MGQISCQQDVVLEQSKLFRDVARMEIEKLVKNVILSGSEIAQNIDFVQCDLSSDISVFLQMKRKQSD